MNRSFLFTTFLLFLISQITFGQRPPKWGKITSEEKAITKSEIDEEANAIILSDYCEIDFLGNNLTVAQHRRIKILNENGKEEANITIPFYAKDNIEKVYKIKAQTILIDERGKTKKIKLKKSDFFTVDINENWKEVRFALPNIEPGAIIEYEFVKTSESVVSLEKWNFQNEIPTLRSQVNVNIAAGLDYKIVYNGDRLINKYGSENRNSWMLTNLPPIKDEPYCSNPMDYTESIRFQLARYKKYSDLPGGGVQWVELMSSWEKLAIDLLQDEDYERISKARRTASDMVDQIVVKGDSDLEKVKKNYAYVQQNIKWNGKFRLFPKEKFSTIFEKKEGSSAEINLCLVRLLNSAELVAKPVIISTKENGLITKVYPLYSQFNHVLASVKIGGKDILMDAISSSRSYNLLGMRDYTYTGYLLDKKKPRWVKIDYPEKTKEVILTNLDITEEKLMYKFSFSFNEHEAAFRRNSYNKSDSEKEFINKYLLRDLEENEMELDSFEVKNLDKLEKPFVVVCYVSKELEEGLDVGFLYIDPFLVKHFSKNPFSSKDRFLPIDFQIPFKERYIFNLNLPDGFEVAEPIESLKLVTPEKRLNYSYQYSGIGKRVQISSEFEVYDPLIFPKDYNAVRELFTQLTGLQSTQLVLKRKD